MSPSTETTPNTSEKKGRRLPSLAGLNLLVVLALFATAELGIRSTTRSADRTLERANLLGRAQTLSQDARIAHKTLVQEWKNVLLRGEQPEDYVFFLEAFQAQQNALRDDLGDLGTQLHALDVATTEIDSIQAAVVAMNQSYQNALSGHDPQDAAALSTADQAVRGIGRQLSRRLAELTATIDAARDDFLQESRDRRARWGGILRRWVRAIGAVAVVSAIALLAMLLYAGRVKSPAS